MIENRFFSLQKKRNLNGQIHADLRDIKFKVKKQTECVISYYLIYVFYVLFISLFYYLENRLIIMNSHDRVLYTYIYM